jgi:hypothetical protein
MASNAAWLDGDLDHRRFRRAIDTTLAGVGTQYEEHACMSSRRFSKASPRR